MSSAIVQKALELVDQHNSNEPQKFRKEKKARDLLGNKHLKNIHGTNKVTVSQLRKNHKTKEEIYKKNLEKLELIRKLTSVELDKGTKKLIIQRAVTKKPVKKIVKKKKGKSKKSAFTEEDFQKFEEEYTGD